LLNGGQEGAQGERANRHAPFISPEYSHRDFWLIVRKWCESGSSREKYLPIPALDRYHEASSEGYAWRIDILACSYAFQQGVDLAMYPVWA